MTLNTAVDLTNSAQLEEIGQNLLGDAFFTNKPVWIKGNISQFDAPFLAGLIKKVEPKHLVEIGVASGFSSAVLLKAANSDNLKASLSAIDISPQYYLDEAIPTGQAVSELTPEYSENYNLITGKPAFEIMEQVGDVDFVFIDAHHMHPWAALDMIAVLPFVRAGCWVAFHDLNLCRFERHKHTNRGPYYMFNLWPSQKIHSTQNPTMIGAVLLEKHPSSYLEDLLEIIYTPWEVRIGAQVQSGLVSFIERNFDGEWAAKFSEAFRLSDLRLAASVRPPN